jgi:AcrR family transcriptional regulator
MTRKRIDNPEVRKTQILAAAEAVMSEKGYHGILLDDVAKKAGVSKGTLYLYFKDKEDLLTGLLSIISSEYWQRVTAISGLDRLPPMDKIRRIVTETVKAMSAHKTFFAQLSMDPDSYGEKAARSMKESFTCHLTFLSGVFKDAIQAKKLRPFDPMLAAFMLMSLVRSMVTVDRTILPVDERADKMADMILDLLLKGLEK